MKKKSHEILEKIRTLILSKEFKEEYRIDNKNFTRNSIITFPTLVFVILNLMRKSLQVELNNFCKNTFLPFISKQAFSAARKKISPLAFNKLNKELIKEFYSDNEFKTFRGYRLVIVDGSNLQLPEGDSIKKIWNVLKSK